MKTASANRSGVVSIVPEEDAISPEALVSACHGILNAAGTLLMNVEWMTSHAGECPEGQAVADDARVSVERIAKLARVIQAAARSRFKAA